MMKDGIPAILETLRENRWKYGSLTVRERIRILKSLHKAVYDNREKICKSVQMDLGKAYEEVLMTEVYPVLSEIRHTMRYLGRWSAPRHVRTPLAFAGAKARVLREPKGVVLVISPWNYPFYLALGPVVSAIAAGNCGILKPSEYSPNTSGLIGRLMGDALPEGMFHVIQGGPSETQELLKNRFDHIFFTGSTNIGSLIMEAAAKHLTSVTLELGGKSPAFIHESADLGEAAEKICWGKFVNAGQTCVAPDYVLLPKGKKDVFIKKAIRQIGGFYGEDLSKRPVDFCRIASGRHFDRLTGLLTDAVASGATVESGGGSVPEDLYIQPTIISGIPLDSALMREEIFGPILPVIEYGDIGEALRIANSMGEPLALYVFARDRRIIGEFISRTKSGDVMVNGTVAHVGNPALPFGGLGRSGIGKSHGFAGFMGFSHTRTVMELPRHSTLKLFYPPYSRISRWLAEMALRWL